MSIDSLNGLPDWLLLLIFLSFGAGGPMLFSKAAAKLPSVFGWASRWLQSRDPQVKAEATKSAAYDAQAKEIERLAAQYDRIAQDYQELVGRVEHLEERLDVANKRFFAAVDHIRELRLLWGRNGVDDVLPSVPDVIKDFV